MPPDDVHCPHCGAANTRTRTGTQPLFSQKPKPASGPIDALPHDAPTAAAGIDASSGEGMPVLPDTPAPASAIDLASDDEVRRAAEAAATAEVSAATGAPRETLTEHPAVEEPSIKEGDVLLDHYRVVKQLGEGGMGTVYLAIDDASQQKVAVKVLPAELAQNADIRERFQLEAQALASLDHPNIVPLHIFSQRGGERYLVMKYVEGQSVDDLIKDGGQVSFVEAREIFRALVSALDFAHQKGVIHRDVKPANVLRADDGRIFLVDFGIAKQETGNNVTQTGILMGTPQYMSPEQIKGMAIDGRSDLYAAGLLLYEMLCGVPPFQGEKTFAILRAHVEAPIPDPQLLRDDVIPDDLRSVIASLMQKNPDERPATGAEVIEMLDGKRALQAPEFGVAPQPANKTPVTMDIPPTAIEDAFRQSHELDFALDDDIALPKNRAPFLFVLVLVVVAALGLTWSYRHDLSKLVFGGEQTVEKKLSLKDRAQAELDNKDGQAAQTLLEVHLQDHPNDVEAFAKVGHALLLLNKREEAKAHLKKTRALAKAQKDPAKFAVDIAALQAAIDAHEHDERERIAAEKRAAAERAAAAKAAAERERMKLPVDLTNAQLLAVTDSPKAQTQKRNCWETIVLRKDPKATANITMELRIHGDSGRVTKSKVVRRTLNNKRFEACLDKVVKRWRFPRFRGADVLLNHVMEFRSN